MRWMGWTPFEVGVDFLIFVICYVGQRQVRRPLSAAPGEGRRQPAAFLETDADAFDTITKASADRYIEMLRYKTCNLDMDQANRVSSFLHTRCYPLGITPIDYWSSAIDRFVYRREAVPYGEMTTGKRALLANRLTLV